MMMRGLSALLILLLVSCVCAQYKVPTTEREMYDAVVGGILKEATRTDNTYAERLVAVNNIRKSIIMMQSIQYSLDELESKFGVIQYTIVPDQAPE